jgi:SAM-dependent methyltransferase
VSSFYDGDASIFVEAYDAFHGAGQYPLAGDIDFYAGLARRTGGPVLELGCGTARVALPLAMAGFEVTGIDLSAPMLAVARRKLLSAPQAVRERLTLIEADMTAIDLDRRFGCVIVPFRSFQQLLTVNLQRAVLRVMRRHLRPGGRVALHLYDPRLDVLVGDGGAGPIAEGIHPVTGRRYAAEVLRCRFDYVAQVRHDTWRYTERDDTGRVIDEATRDLAVRWTFRWELHHLLAASGFSIEAEYSDFAGAGPAYGRELIVVARSAAHRGG